MTQHEAEMRALIKNVNPEIIEVLTNLAEAMLKDQMAQEEKKYAKMLTSPAEVAEIIRNDRDGFMLKTAFAFDTIRYYVANCNIPFEVHTMFGKGEMLAYLLLEAGRIIGIRQERARRQQVREAAKG